MYLFHMCACMGLHLYMYAQALYWAVQMGLLTPLTFARHCLSPLAAFTSGVYFHHGRWWQSICKFYTANFNDIFGCLESECVWQQAITCCLCYRMPQNAFFPWTSNLLVSQKMTQGHFFPTLHPLSLVIFATATVVAFVLLHNSRFSFHCYTQCEVMPTQKLAQKWHCDLLQHLVWKITKGIHSCKPASLNHPIEGVPYQISILNKFSVPFTCTDLYIDLTDTENNTEWLWS